MTGSKSWFQEKRELQGYHEKLDSPTRSYSRWSNQRLPTGNRKFRWVCFFLVATGPNPQPQRLLKRRLELLNFIPNLERLRFRPSPQLGRNPPELRWSDGSEVPTFGGTNFCDSNWPWWLYTLCDIGISNNTATHPQQKHGVFSLVSPREKKQLTSTSPVFPSFQDQPISSHLDLQILLGKSEEIHSPCRAMQLSASLGELLQKHQKPTTAFLLSADLGMFWTSSSTPILPDFGICWYTSFIFTISIRL